MPDVVIDLPRPFPAQAEILNFQGTCCVFAGRRFGKTQVGVYKIYKHALTDIGLYWWVGLSWRSASMKRAWRLIKFYARKIWKALGEIPDRYIREADKEVILPNGSAIWLRTAERPESLAGEAVKGAVVDEFTLMPESVWTEYLEGTLLDYADSWALFIGVPKGENWASKLWRAAKYRKGWARFQFTSYDNPHIDPAKIDAIKANVTSTVFDQEYMAQIIPDGTGVFKNLVAACVVVMQKGPIPGHDYAAGLDFGKDIDYSCISIIDSKMNQQVFMDRFNYNLWDTQLDLIITHLRLWQPKVLVAEYNNIGGPLIELLQTKMAKPVKDADGKVRLPEIRTTIVALTTSNQNKTEIVDACALDVERNNFRLLEDDIQLSELQGFVSKRLPSGKVRYAASNGMHDDTVMALCLSHYAATSNRAYGGIHV